MVAASYPGACSWRCGGGSQPAPSGRIRSKHTSPGRLPVTGSSVVTRLQLGHLTCRLFGPCWITRSVLDSRRHREASPKLFPAVVFFNLDAHRHTLHDLG